MIACTLQSDIEVEHNLNSRTCCECILQNIYIPQGNSVLTDCVRFILHRLISVFFFLFFFHVLCIFFHVSDTQCMFYCLYVSTIQSVIPGTCNLSGN